MLPTAHHHHGSAFALLAHPGPSLPLELVPDAGGSRQPCQGGGAQDTQQQQPGPESRREVLPQNWG